MEQEDKMKRKEFLFKFGVFGVAILALGALVLSFIRYLFPDKNEKLPHKYLVGYVDELKVGEAKEITLSEKPAFVVRLEDGYRVFSGVCTHLGCIISWEAEKERFYCPCHKGIFNKKGEVTAGPPPKPLDEFEVKIEKNLVYIFIEDKTRGPWT